MVESDPQLQCTPPDQEHVWGDTVTVTKGLLADNSLQADETPCLYCSVTRGDIANYGSGNV